MDEFRTLAKLWPSGAPLPGTDENWINAATMFNRTADKFASDGVTTYQFLFWNTGRHTTRKRSVRWNFSVLGWGTWTATRWYGLPGGGGPPRVRADAFSIGDDAVLSPTPIDSAASTFAAGSYPFNGDDHAIGTANGKATVVAKDPLNSYDFAGWLQLIWGGDDSGDFVESDAGSGGTIGGVGFYDHVVGGSFSVAKGVSADLLATYGYHAQSRPWTIREVEAAIANLKIPINPGDPGPEDRIRLGILAQLLLQTQPKPEAGTDFQQIIEAAPNMSPAQLKRAVQSIKTSLALGSTALSTLETRLKAKNKR